MSHPLPPRLWIAGHRGGGQTDAAHARRDPLARPKPAENTLASIAQAFRDGADFVEIDAVATGDGQVAVTHSDRLADHVMGPRPAEHVGQLSLERLQALRVGVRGDGTMPSLPQVLALAAQLAPADSPIALNIEIKDTKGTDQPRRSVVDQVLRDVAEGPLPPERILFSSFALADLKEVAAKLPGANLGMLFTQNMSVEVSAYSDPDRFDTRYLKFNPANIDRVMAEAPVTHLHPEIHSLSDRAMARAARHGAAVNTWSVKEKAPEADQRAIERAVTLAGKHRLALGLITDFVPQMRQQLAPALARSGLTDNSGVTAAAGAHHKKREERLDYGPAVPGRPLS